MSRNASNYATSLDPPVRRTLRKAFTLVELLVSVSVICVLIGMLLPLLGRVSEAGRRTKCAANLRSIGQIATLFANDHNGFFPACYRMGDSPAPPAQATMAFPYRVPQYITTDTTHDVDNSSVTGWQQYGTSWNVFRQYAGGSNERLYAAGTGIYQGDSLLQTFSCPSVETAAHEIDMANNSTHAEYGNFIVTNYVYLGGLSDQNMQIPPTVFAANPSNQSRSHWGSAPPAVSTSGSPLYTYQVDPNNTQSIIKVSVGTASLSRSVLAADLVFFSGVNYTPKIYKINHPRPGDATLADFQNVLYGDGRVEGHTQSEYPNPLNDDSGAVKQNSYDWSMKYADGQPGYYYWGEPESTPGPALQPPSTDAVPVNPNGDVLTGSQATPPPPPALPPIVNPPPPLPQGIPSPLPA